MNGGKGTRREVMLGALACGAVAGVASSASAASGGVHQVVIKNFKFTPSELQVRPGDRIRWTNEDRAAHNAAAGDRSWKTANLRRGQSAELEVTAGMAGDYICSIHPRMRARLVIV